MADLVAPLKALSLKDVEKADLSSEFAELSSEELALESQWLTLSKRLPESLVEFNDNLRNKTYLLGNKASIADVKVFVKVLPILTGKNYSVEELAQFRHVFRWADLIQNSLITIPDDMKLKLNYDVEIPREVKAKPEKKKKDSASTATGTKEAKKEKKSAQASAPAQAASAAGAESASASGATSKEEDPEKKAKAEAKKAAKAKAKAEQEAKAKAAAVPPNPSMIDFRVGFIQKAVKHPDADSLYVSTIDMGDEEGPRTVCSGLVNYFPLEAMQERYVVVIANLKPVTMRGIKSCAMVLCASDEGKVEFVNPPPGSKPGDKIFFEGFDGTPEKVLNPKKKIWETVQPNFSTNDKFEVIYKQEGKPDAKLVNSKGEVLHNSTIVNANVR
ncbi:hypothetical protein PACTADRAFT_74014 [Pachysolen tannophilus NRRL Y-2460]|uniref:tRNA-binding domain-containing protein n=1 Tax=Pachysolen tannophilus NRRL Y-2460 TaxID=669874 RepID=A0A1E4U368_PACTA|nr:hypothetical protein PACTADRAFT_74014 [Pachysolen tannophilus NRRL Y-2460]